MYLKVGDRNRFKKIKFFLKWMKFLENIIKYVMYLCKKLFIFSQSQKKIRHFILYYII